MKFVSNKSSQGIYLDLDLGLLISTEERVCDTDWLRGVRC